MSQSPSPSAPESSPSAAPGSAPAPGDKQPDSYDVLPYLSRCFAQTHPDNLAVAARLRGLQPAPIDRCRVLELGCAGGGNLLPLAATWPGSTFVGIDRSVVQVQQGNELVAQAGLKNIELRIADLMEFEGEPGSFDYILCHGVYSWVPEAVQARIFALCQRLLAPHGIAYISYNTYPGFYRRQPIMEMMRYHVRALGLTKPREIVQHARELVTFLIQSAPDSDSTTVRLLREEAERLAKVPDSYVFHEHFEADNRPCYFYQFMDAASAHGLQFLDEAVAKGGAAGLPDQAQQTLAEIAADVVRYEQYVDFIRNTAMRSTLLCRKEQALTAEPGPEVLRSLLVRCAAAPENPAELMGSRLLEDRPVKFVARVGSAQIDHPHFKALLLALYLNRPCAMTFPQLSRRTMELLGRQVPTSEIFEMALYGHRAGICSLHTQSPPVTQRISDKPCASPLARVQVLHDNTVATQWHMSATLDPLRQTLLSLLDGTRDQAALHAALLAAIEGGTLTLPGPGGAPLLQSLGARTLSEQLRAVFLPKALASLAELGLLVS